MATVIKILFYTSVLSQISIFYSVTFVIATEHGKLFTIILEINFLRYVIKLLLIIINLINKFLFKFEAPQIKVIIGL